MIELDNTKAFVEYTHATKSRGAHFKIYFGDFLSPDRKDNKGYVTVSAEDHSHPEFEKLRKLILVDKLTFVGYVDIWSTNIDTYNPRITLEYVKDLMQEHNIKGKVTFYK